MYVYTRTHTQVTGYRKGTESTWTKLVTYWIVLCRGFKGLGKSPSQWIAILVGITCKRIDGVIINATNLHLLSIVIHLVALGRTAIGEVTNLHELVVSLRRNHRMS